jgi:hypothetical protein
MKRILLMAVISATILLACNTARKGEPQFFPGDMVRTRFGEVVLIIDTTINNAMPYYQGVYKVKRSGKSEIEEMYAAELDQKTN